MDRFQKVPRFARYNVFNRQCFEDMLGAYKSRGGTARADELAQLLEETQTGNFVSVAKRIVSQDILSFEWQNHFWIPMFQFNHEDMSVKQTVRRVAQELNTVLDNWTLALWFTEPNAWLRGRRPVDMVDSQFAAVWDAARADRFVAAGR